MTEFEDPRFVPADYRVRLFLSVDLSGSTAFKNSSSGEERHDGSAPRWVTVFQQFYADFPALFRSEYQKQTNGSVGNDGCPKLWKAVGDELVFCGKVSNQKACIAALNSFISTLHIYRKRLQNGDISLNVKGAGWLAAFPEPNRTVQLRKADGSAELLTASEALEVSADEAPFDYDFLGKAIDTGFRVASNSTPERFVLSVQLARLLVGIAPEQGFAHRVRLNRPLPLKGVNRDNPYPILYIDTMVHLPMEQTRILEREVLREREPPDPGRLLDYLEAYCTVVGTDEVVLKLDASADPIDPPRSYLEHKSKIADHLQSEMRIELDASSDQNSENETDGQELEDVELEPLQKGLS